MLGSTLSIKTLALTAVKKESVQSKYSWSVLYLNVACNLTDKERTHLNTTGRQVSMTNTPILHLSMGTQEEEEAFSNRLKAITHPSNPWQCMGVGPNSSKVLVAQKRCWPALRVYVAVVLPRNVVKHLR